MPSDRIEDYGLIGDCETGALVGRDGSIDWLCWPRFDSPACFAALLGTEENGRWKIAPIGDAVVSRRYRPRTLILETRFETAAGSVLLIDFMPPRGTDSDIVRLVVGESGRVAMRMELVLRYDYGRVMPWVHRLEDGSLRAIGGPDMTVLRTPIETHGEDMHTVSDFEVAAGETVPFVLAYCASHRPVPEPIDPFAALADTEAFWTEWTARYEPAALDGKIDLPEPWHQAARRSLITLKAMTYAPTGGIVAAVTTSLPEWLGSTRNWDYRYCWLRDSALTLFALMNAGYYDEARAWRDWLLRAIAGSPEQMQIMYGIAGERRLLEWEVDWLPGFADSKPVRVGNAAADQTQLDVYGEIMSLLHQARLGGLPESPEAWSIQVSMLERLDDIWREPDYGIWEVRGPPRHFTLSKLMVWLAFDRCIKSAEIFGLDHVPLEKWRAIRSEVKGDVLARGWNAEVGAFTQSYDDTALDASLLLLPMLGFLDDDDPRVRLTVEAIEADLLVDGLVQRYHTSTGHDGLPPGEGTFLACSFWLVEALVLIGRLADAEALFERLLALRNDLGLLAEEYDPIGGRQLGNFPQAFSHVALVNAAHRLAAARAGSGDRSEELQKGEVPA
ncbi:glycoside hydrolase family 15 protein [Enterovirga rhinocerotis]|uniref:Trehalase n=1 Tax=Enterovirga rhinocerotis TaxID=1339210 RepID=A0A4R7C9S4_9HYPH|nr:glycoside hydrolase family 15 protein [Enterovirga rhinocerotis]TDR94802.1 GH15 family glucan-1,4-alpha-glucosidase [Enterovirga rhinocerotis]